MNTYNIPFKQHFALFASAGILQCVLLGALFLRQTPFMRPYVTNIWHYFPHALGYAWYGVALISLPFLIAAALKKNHSPLLYRAHVAVHAFLLVFSQADNELQRFMGTHLTYDFFTTYVRDTAGNIPPEIYNAVRTDAGGSYGAFLWLLIPILFVVAAFAIRRLTFESVDRIPPRVAYALLAVLFLLAVVLPFTLRTPLFGSKNRQAKVAPPPILIKDAFVEMISPNKAIEDIDRKAEIVRERWKNIDTASWHLDPNPLSMHKSTPLNCDSAQRPNIIYISVETGRARNMQWLNPEAEVEATPFLKKLAHDPKSEYYRNFFCAGQPTVFAFMAVHTSLPPHSKKTTSKFFTRNHFAAFPLYLRENGYHTYFYSVSDPDWDNSSFWLARWYDEYDHRPSDYGKDRVALKNFVEHIKQLPKDKPFFAGTFLISNHIPFHTQEKEFEIFDSNDLHKKIYNTLRYVDDAIRETYESLKNEDFFKNTVFIVTADHGYDLGERGESLGHANCRHETTWIPLIIHGNHPLIRQGAVDRVASQLDIAPTVLHLAGICAPNPFFGHSLYEQNDENFAPNIKDGNTCYQNKDFSAYFPFEEKAELYHGNDPLQKNNVADTFPNILPELKKFNDAYFDFSDYTIENYNKIYPQYESRYRNISRKH